MTPDPSHCVLSSSLTGTRITRPTSVHYSFKRHGRKKMPLWALAFFFFFFAQFISFSFLLLSFPTGTFFVWNFFLDFFSSVLFSTTYSYNPIIRRWRYVMGCSWGYGISGPEKKVLSYQIRTEQQKGERTTRCGLTRKRKDSWIWEWWRGGVSYFPWTV